MMWVRASVLWLLTPRDETTTRIGEETRIGLFGRYELRTRVKSILVLLVALSAFAFKGFYANQAARQVQSVPDNHVLAVPASLSAILTLTCPNGQLCEGFGGTVAASGNMVVIGAAQDTVDGHSFAGHVYEFSADTGALVRTLTSPNAEYFGAFGSSIAASGNIIVVAAAAETVNGEAGAGRAYVFNAQTGALISTLTSPSPRFNGRFASSVAASGGIVVVSTPFNTLNQATFPGLVYSFNAETGALISTLTNPNPQSDGLFGYSIAMTGNLVVVGAPLQTADGQNGAGRTYVFNAETGILVSTLTSPNAQINGGFGSSVAASGNILVVDAAFETVDGLLNAGHAYVFDSPTGSVIVTLAIPISHSGEGLSSSVATNGKIVVLGQPSEDANGPFGSGDVRAFGPETGALINTFTSPNPQPDGFFGWSIALRGSILVVAAPSEIASGQKLGQVYVFE